MRLGIIRETKTPPDSRVVFTPEQCKYIQENFDVDIMVQPSPSRSYQDEEYAAEGITLKEDLSSCDVLLGVKEVKMETLIAAKPYFFFSHTIKEQPYNKTLLRTILKKKIVLRDYETICNAEGSRVIAFGRWAGIVGAHNGIQAWGKRTQKFDLKAMHLCRDFKEAQQQYNSLDLSNAKILVTGTGRVANGAAEVLDLMNIRKVSKEAFLSEKFNEAVYCQLSTKEMYAKGPNNDFTNAFYEDPSGYHTTITPFLSKTDIFINGIYWDNRAPAFFDMDAMKKESFNIKVIADVTCDIAPEASIPSTLYATVIGKPVFGYDPITGKECAPYQESAIDMMTVDNLPNELPRDASEDFGKQFISNVLPELLKNESEMIYNASITTKDGTLNKPYLYLTNYISE